MRLAWVAALSFASGIPYGLFTDLIPVLLRSHGATLGQIGLLSTLALPWALKFLWAPAVDRLGTRRRWIGAAQLGLALVLVGLAWSGANVSPAYLALILALVALSATQDIAIDAYTIELMDRSELGPANGTRVTAYRLGWIFAGGLLVAASAPLGWTAVLLVGAAIFLGLAALARLIPPTTVEREPHQPLLEPLRELFTRPAIGVAVLFVLTFKVGDLALVPMVKPFWVDSGYSVQQIGWVQTTLGVGASIVGALAGGLATQRLGTFHALWVLGAVQALSNLTYWAAAVTGAQTAMMYGAAVVEQFTQGLGTAAFLTFLMTLCERRYAATQFALLSALYRVGGIAAGALSGVMAERVGYANYFLFTFGLALPAFVLLPWLRRTLARD
ncbi:MAG: MFS transporter [Gemmatimonadales bacterium]|nr:MFS transporter [Gemmatimonadales bacterium]